MTAKRKTETSAAKKPKRGAKPKTAKAPKKTERKKAAPAKAAAAVKVPDKAPKKRENAPAKPKPPRKARPQQGLDLERFRTRLRERQGELLQAYLNAKGDTRTRESDGTEDYIDYAVSSYDREFLLSLTELEQTQLALIDEALKRIAAGTFGLCVQCERPIPTKRLDVQPWARYCLRCQELADSGLAAGSFEFPSDEDEVETVEDTFGDEFEAEDGAEDDDEEVGEDRLTSG